MAAERWKAELLLLSVAVELRFLFVYVTAVASALKCGLFGRRPLRPWWWHPCPSYLLAICRSARPGASVDDETASTRRKPLPPTQRKTQEMNFDSRRLRFPKIEKKRKHYHPSPRSDRCVHVYWAQCEQQQEHSMDYTTQSSTQKDCVE